MSKKPILLAAGGTAGHVFPALALADELTARGFPVVAATDQRGSRYFQGRMDARVLASGGLASGSPLKRLTGVAKLAQGYVQARSLVGKLDPAAVVGFGGYPSAPPLLAAQHLGIATVLHEQNSVFGKANGLTARKATEIALSFSSTKGAPARARYVGNPVREAFLTLPTFARTSDKVRIVGTGGSLGGGPVAQALQEAIALLPGDLRARISLLSQCPAEMIERLRGAYGALALGDVEVTDFIDDMPSVLGAAQLVIARSGATTVTEILAAARPALFVPLDVHADRHQILNAEALVEAGAAKMILQSALSPQKLATALQELLDAPQALATMATAAERLAIEQQSARDGRTAVQALADLVIACAK